MSEKKEQIVATKSKAYGYNYASLGDIVNQGFTIPRMKTGTENNKEYVYCYDSETKEWIRGAEIIIPNMKGMNDAQMYGSALTFSRRYSVMMFLGLVSDDDKNLETQPPKKSEIFDERLPINDLADEFRALFTKEEQQRIYKGLNVDFAEQISEENLKKYVNFKKNEIKTNQNKGNIKGN